MNKSIALITCMVLGLSACAPQEQVTFLEKRIYSLSQKNQELEKAVLELKQQVQALKKAQEQFGASTLLEVRSRQAVFQNKLDEVNAELLRISGMIEEMKHTYSSDREKNQEVLAALQQDVVKLRQELRVLGTVKEKRDKIAHKGKKTKKTGIDVYQKGLDFIKEKKFKEARTTLEKYVKEFPKGALVPNAHFWIGECEYNLNRFEEAILAYEKVIKDYPKSNKVPAALLKEGMAFFKLGDPESAKIIWKKLIKLYPKSSQARLAKKQIERLG